MSWPAFSAHSKAARQDGISRENQGRLTPTGAPQLSFSLQANLRGSRDGPRCALYAASSTGDTIAALFTSEATAIIRFSGNAIKNIFCYILSMLESGVDTEKKDFHRDLSTNLWHPWYPPVHYCSFSPPLFHLISLGSFSGYREWDLNSLRGSHFKANISS